MSKYDRVYYIITIHILINFFMSQYISWTAVSWYSWYMVYRCTPNQLIWSTSTMSSEISHMPHKMAWCHSMDKISALLDICEENTPVTDRFLTEVNDVDLWQFLELLASTSYSTSSWVASDLRPHDVHMTSLDLGCWQFLELLASTSYSTSSWVASDLRPHDVRVISLDWGCYSANHISKILTKWM